MYILHLALQSIRSLYIYPAFVSLRVVQNFISVLTESLVKFLAIKSQFAIQSHHTLLRFVMKEWNCSCVSTRIPKHELDSQAFGNSSEKGLNLVSSETAFLCSPTSPQDVVSDIGSQRNGSDAKSEKTLRNQGHIWFFPRDSPHPDFFFFFFSLPDSNSEIQGHSPIRWINYKPKSSIRRILISLISIIKGKYNLPF